ncbi:MAG: FecR domain-containing protein [Acidobacteriia bacterium]|nr:FecR domain-containing protein [Terriglobia bacterium]
MRQHFLKFIATSIAVFALAVSVNGLWAQDSGYPQPDYTQNGDSSYHGRVVRLSLVEGDVSLQHGSDGQWLDATINAPLVQGDRIWVGAQGRTEVEFDDGTYVRLASNSVLEIQNLDLNSDGRYSQVFLSQGLAYVNVRDSYNDTFRVTTPSMAADVYRGARFSIGVNGNDDVTVFRGEVVVNSPSGEVKLHANDSFSLATDGSGHYDLSQASSPDSWARWNFDRDSYLTRASSSQYVPSSVSYGTYDLDHYGRWAYENDYGYVWQPYGVDSSWIPYSYGRWVWYPGIGYTWVSYEPWGWLPYHYGSWAYISGFGWGWHPGASFAYWSPARVFFFNYGSYVGWCPFSPFDNFFGGGTFININVFRPRNFFVNRVVVVNNNTFINNVITRENLVRNREVITQATSARNVQFASQPRVERTRASEVLRPSTFAGGASARLATDSKGWNREDNIRGTGARPSEALRSPQPFAGANRSPVNREAMNTPSGQNNGTWNREGTNRQAPNTVTRPELNNRSREQTSGRGTYSAPPPSREAYGSQGNRGAYTPPPARTEAARPQGQGTPYNAPPPKNERSVTPQQNRNREESRPKTDPRSPNGSNFVPQREGWQSSPANRGNYNPPPVQSRSYINSYNGSNQMSTLARQSVERPSTSAPAQRYQSQAPRSYQSAPMPRESFSRPTYSAPAAPQQSYSRPTYSAPSMPRETFSRPSYSAPSYSAPSYRSAPAAPQARSFSAPRSESRPSNNSGSNKNYRR